MHPEIIQDKPGQCPKCGMNLVPLQPKEVTSGLHQHESGHTTHAVDSAHKESELHVHDVNHEGESLTKYTCPMHPQILQDGPGKCPLCGMNLVPLAKSGKHNGHESHSSGIADFRKRFYVVLILTIPIMLLSEMIQHWLNIHFSFPGSNYVLLALSSIVFFYGGWPFLKGLADEIKVKNPGMMTLIGFAISVAYIYSVATYSD
jgi:Cu2+-exporting ATPase